MTNPHRDRDLEATLTAANKAADAVAELREKLWSLMQKDPAYGLIVLNGLRSAGREFFRASSAVEMGADILSDLLVIDRSGVA